MTTPQSHPGQLTLITLTLTERVIQQLESVARSSNSTISAVADELLDDLLRPFTDE